MAKVLTNDDISYITTPTLLFEEQEVLTKHGKGWIAGKHRWEDINVQLLSKDLVKELENLAESFDIEFISDKFLWTINGCKIVARSSIRPGAVTVEYHHALLTEQKENNDDQTQTQ